jgi:uncharacterized SAM-binding protein YcdF (DUF218 family)
MFFLLSKILYFLLLPLSWILITLAWALLTQNPYHRRNLRRVAIFLMVVFTNPALSHLALRALEYRPTEVKQPLATAVVLSGILDVGIDVPHQYQFNESADRLVAAIRLYHQGMIGQLLITGGAADIRYPERNEGEYLKDILLTAGIPDSAILLENQARNTHENALFTKRLLPENEKVLLITSAFHMHRAAGCFQKQGISFQPYPVDFRAPDTFGGDHLVPSAQALQNWNIVVKEVVGLVTYRVMGYL